MNQTTATFLTRRYSGVSEDPVVTHFPALIASSCLDGEARRREASSNGLINTLIVQQRTRRHDNEHAGIAMIRPIPVKQCGHLPTPPHLIV